MPPRQRAITVGVVRGRRLLVDIGGEVRSGRLETGMTQAELGQAVGASRAQIGRVERAELESLSVLLLSRIATVIGRDLVIKLYPNGAPARDSGHTALLECLRGRVAAPLDWERERPMPSRGDQRAFDAAILDRVRGRAAGVEAEMHLHDEQALLRSVRLKQRDSGIDVVVLLVNDTAHNRRFLAGSSASFRDCFPARPREVLSALSRGRLPERSGIVVL